MASTFKSAKCADGVQPRCGIGVTSVSGEYSIAAALVINDVIQMVKIPKGATILDMVLAADDLDTNVSPAITLDVGDGTTADRFIAASTIAQGGGVARLGQVDGVQFTYTADDTIDVKVKAAPGTGATEGHIRLTVLYTMDK